MTKLADLFTAIGDFFEGLKKEQFECWLKKVIGQDNRFSHLLDSECEMERLNFYKYFDKKMSPWQALREEYRKEGGI